MDKNNDGFGQGDYIDFLAEGFYNRYTSDVVYTLEIDSKLTKPAVEVTSESLGRAFNIATANVKLEDQNEFWVSSPDLEDPYAMAVLYATTSATSKTFTLDLPALNTNSGEANFSINLLGGTDTDAAIDHSVEVVINGTSVEKVQFSGKKAKLVNVDVATSLLKEVGNSIEIVLPLDIDVAYDLVALDSIEVSYPRYLQAQGTPFKVVTNEQHLNVSQLNVGDAVYQSVKGTLVRTGADASSLVVSSANSQDASTLFVATGELLKPEVQSIVAEKNITAGEAEYLVISHPSFIDENLEQLVNLRQGTYTTKVVDGQGTYTTKVVDVNQVYTQFGRGVAEASPIQDYIQYAAKELGTKMVLLVGGDTHDYHGYLGNSVSHIPTLYKVAGGLNVTINHAPSDAAYGDIISFEQRDYKGTSVFAADNIDNGYSHSFAEEAEAVIASLPEQVAANVVKAFAEEVGVNKAGDTVINSVNNGVELTAYLGHSSMYKWASEGILDTQDLTNLTNASKPTVMAQYGCWNTYFTLPDGNSMAQVALLDSKNGAATVMGASTLTLAKSEVALGKALFETLYVPGKTLGEALIEAKKNISAKSQVSDVLLGWQILGDPAIVMNPAQ